MKAMPSVMEVINQQRPELALVDARLRDVLASRSTFTNTVVQYLASSGGKRLRPALVVLFGGLGAESSSSKPQMTAALIEAATAAELIHLASLVHDDIIDRAGTRRGRATVNARWNDRTAVLSGDYLFATAFGMLAKAGLYRVLELMTDAIREMCEGEMDEDNYVFNPSMTEADYMDYIGKKTASLIRACCASGAVIAGLPEDQVVACGEFGAKLGCAFQIVDDVLDFTSKEDDLGKPVGSDLAQGVITLPVLAAMWSSEFGEFIRLLIGQKKLGREQIQRVVDAIKGCDGISYAYRRAVAIAGEAKDNLGRLPVSDLRQTLMNIADFVVERAY